MVNRDKTHKLILAGDIGGGKGNQHETQLVEFLGGGQFEIRGMISDLNSDSLALRIEDSTVTFYTASRHTGDTTVVNSRLVLGSGDVVSHLSKLVLDGSSLETNGFDDLLGAFRVVTESVVDFGAGDSDLWFQHESGYVFDAPLSLLNFDIGIDSMRFGTSGGSLDEEQLSFIRLPGYNASLDDEGYVRFTAIPEPATWILVLAGLAVAAMKSRRTARFRGIKVSLVCFAAGVAASHAEGFKWTSTSSTLWTDANNWSPKKIPGLNDDAWFEGVTGTTVDLGAGASIHNLTLRSDPGLQYKIGAFPIGSQTLTFQGTGGLFNSSGRDGGVTFVADIVLGGDGESGQYLFAYYARGVSIDFLGSVSGAGDGPKELNLTGFAAYNFAGPISTGDSEWLSISIYDNAAPTTFYAQNTYIGTTTVSRSTLALGASDVMPDNGSFRLDGGTLRTNGFDDVLGSLFLFEDVSTIDFGTGGSDLSFDDSSVFTWLGSVRLTNFDIGVDSLRFGTNANGLNGEQLSLIRLPGYVASLDEEGYVQFTAVPEPSSIGMLVLGFGLSCLLVCRRFVPVTAFVALFAVSTGISSAASGLNIELSENKIVKANDGKPLVVDANIIAEDFASRIELPWPNIRNLDPLNPIIFNGSVWQREASGRTGSAGAVKISGPGWVEFRGVIDSGNLAFLDLYIQDGHASLSGNNGYSGNTKVAASTLRMDVSNVLSDRSTLILQDGRLETNGFDDISPVLRVRGASWIDFGLGESSLWFQRMDFLDKASSLNLSNFDIGKDSLRLGENGDSLPDEQLALIHLDGYEASLDDEGYLQFTPVPEPAHLALAGMALFLSARMRRELAH